MYDYENNVVIIVMLQSSLESEDGLQSVSAGCDVRDPVCDEFYHDTWSWSARRNMQLFEEVSIVPNKFNVRIVYTQCIALQVFGGKNIPTDSVHSYEELKKFRVSDIDYSVCVQTQ